MRNLLLLVVCVAFHQGGLSQDTTIKRLQEEAIKRISIKSTDTINRIWKAGGLFTVNITQGALSNWQGGGDKNSFSAVAFLNLFADYKKDRIIWDNTLDLGYGYLKTTSLGTRKSDDRIDVVSRYGYKINKKWYGAALVNFRTQFTQGYGYSNDSSGVEVKKKTSDFMAPGYALFSLGFEYKPTTYFSIFISPLTQRWTIVIDKFLSSIGAYGVNSGDHVKNELGAFLSAEFNKEVAKNVNYKTRLDVFSNYKKDPQNVDVYWTNVIGMKVNKYLSTNLIIDLLYDDDAIGRWQIRQLLGIGVSIKL